MPSKDRKKKRPEDYHLLAESRGFRWLGPEVPTTKTLTTWECPRGHQWRAIYNNIQQGRDCPQCVRRKKPVDYHLLAKKRNFQWLGPPVASTITFTRWKCELGHEWEACYREILRGDNCPYCKVSPATDNPLSNNDISGDETDRNEQWETKAAGQADDANTRILYDWWGKNSISFLIPLFSSAKELIRLSTGFFSIQGYNLLKAFVENKHVDIMVGYDDRSKDDLKMTLIDEIIHDLNEWNRGKRREAVLHLVEKLEKRELRIVDARLRHKDHSKIYIFDSSLVASGSTNLTKNGLQVNQEGDLTISKIDQSDRVEWWCNQYEQLSSLWRDKSSRIS